MKKRRKLRNRARKRGVSGKYETGLLISGLEAAAARPGVFVFHAGTRRTNEGIVTAGGRVLGGTALAQTLREAVALSYAAVGDIDFPGMHYRRDIGQRNLR